MKHVAIDIYVPESPEEEKEVAGIFSKSPTRAYSEGWERIFGKKEAEIVSPEDKKNIN